jgi:hypothetical protein
MLLAALLAATLVLAAASQANAVGWNVQSQGDCTTGLPRGASWLNWDGQPSSSVGETWGYLWYSSGSWILKSQGYDQRSGSTNNASVSTSAAYAAGNWIETGNHQATFFGGTVTSEGNVFTC